MCCAHPKAVCASDQGRAKLTGHPSREEPTRPAFPSNRYALVSLGQLLGSHFELEKLSCSQRRGLLDSQAAGRNRGNSLARVGHVGAIDHRVEDQLRVFVDDADGTPHVPRLIRMSPGLIRAASDPTGVAINRPRCLPKCPPPGPFLRRPLP